jgi:hypothetical protein
MSYFQTKHNVLTVDNVLETCFFSQIHDFIKRDLNQNISKWETM